MRSHTDSIAAVHGALALRAVRLRRARRHAQADAPVQAPRVAHIVADLDDVECDSTVASSLAWRRRWHLADPS